MEDEDSSKCKVLKQHDDGDITIQCGGSKFVLTTEGEVYRELDGGISLLVHALPEAEGLGGIVVNPDIAGKTPCTCYDNICFSKGIIGALSPSEREAYCKEIVQGTSPRMKARLVKWDDAKTVCKEKTKELPKGEKVVEYTRCMGMELSKRGVSI